MSLTTKMRRLNCLSSMINTRTTMNCHEKASIINAVALKRSHSRTYFMDLEMELLCKVKDGLNLISAHNDLSEMIARNLSEWNGFLALLMSTWFFVDIAIELGARRWISRTQEKKYVNHFFDSLFIRLRGPQWDFIRANGWSALKLYINNLQCGLFFF